MFAPRSLLAVLLVVGAACAQKTTSVVHREPPRWSHLGSARTRTSSASEELRDPTIAGADAMTAIRQLRPAFFRTRGPQSFTNASAGQVQISQDYGPLQGVNSLVRSTPAASWRSATSTRTTPRTGSGSTPTAVP